jgi:hypothetical protein
MLNMGLGAANIGQTQALSQQVLELFWVYYSSRLSTLISEQGASCHDRIIIPASLSQVCQTAGDCPEDICLTLQLLRCTAAVCLVYSIPEDSLLSRIPSGQNSSTDEKCFDI